MAGFIAERLNRELPLPTAADERAHLLDRVMRDLFGAAPTAEETTAFVADLHRLRSIRWRGASCIVPASHRSRAR